MNAEATAWDFVVRRHAEPGVEAACLALQDSHGQCVALLMWRAWTLDRRLALGPEVLHRAVAAARIWDAQVIAPLRAVRRRLGFALPELTEAQGRRLRRGLLEQELAMERALIETLAELATAAPASAATPRARGDIEALASTARLWGGEAPDDLLAKLTGA